MSRRYATLIGDPTTSFWLADALQSALKRDPVDALADAEILVLALRDNQKHAIVEAMFSNSDLTDLEGYNIEFKP